ncbi:MAG: branched-chain amino acid transport system substrate-binding protein [Halovenus sp.]|jgi:branched-chain amino acid transport system substrate-binding protein
MSPDRISRRRLLGSLGATGVVALAGCIGGDDDSSSNGGENGGTNGGENGGTNGGETGGTNGGENGGTTTNPSGTLRIGVLQDYSGQLAIYGAQGTAGFYSGLAHKADSDPLSSDAVSAGDYTYSVNDIDIEIRARDTEFAPAQA